MGVIPSYGPITLIFLHINQHIESSIIFTAPCKADGFYENNYKLETNYRRLTITVWASLEPTTRRDVLSSYFSRL